MAVPRHLAPLVHDHYFRQQEEFKPRTVWSLSNAFRSAFKEFAQFRQFRAAANLAGFLEDRSADVSPWVEKRWPADS
jgi:hypothetical protein